MPIRDPSRWQTQFGSWVSRYGVRPLTRDLGAAGEPQTNKAVYHWISGSTRPRPHVAQILVRLSGGELSLDVIYEHRALVTRTGNGNGTVHNRSARPRENASG
jgi:hypothetical protein